MGHRLAIRPRAADQGQLGAEYPGQRARGAGDRHPPRTGVASSYLNGRLQTPEHPGHELVVGRVGPVLLLEVGSGQPDGHAVSTLRQRGGAPGNQR